MIMPASLTLTLSNGKSVSYKGFYNKPPKVGKSFAFNADGFGLIETGKIRHMVSEPPHGNLEFSDGYKEYRLILNV